MEAQRPIGGEGNVDFSSLMKSKSAPKENALKANGGSPQQELTEFKGMSLENKIKTLAGKVPSSNLEMKSIKSDDHLTTGNVLRRDLAQFAKLDRLALSGDEAKLLEDSLGGKLARRDASKWGKDDVKASIDMTATTESIKPIANKMNPQELAIIKTSHEILNKLYENWQ